jgi:hypothetical protein
MTPPNRLQALCLAKRVAEVLYVFARIIRLFL